MDEALLLQELKSLGSLSQAWSEDRHQMHRVCLDTLAGVLLSSSDPKQWVDQVLALLFKRSQELSGVYSDDLWKGLSLVERFMLIACHQHQWSYHRVCQRLHINTSQLEISLWKARLHLAHVQDWPMGPSQSSAECPEYHLARPWPQRFFDQAWETAKERCDQQKHLLQCQSCLNFLNRCRVVYYQVDQRIKSGMKEEDWSDDFKQIIQMSPQSRVFRKSARQQVVQLMSGRDMKWLFWIWFFFLLFKGFYKITG